MKENLNDSHKARRHRRNMLNIQITFLAWLFETIGLFILFLGQFILGHENNIVIFSMQTLSVMIYFNILPSILILNDTNFKNVIVDSQWYDHFLKDFGWKVPIFSRYNCKEQVIVFVVTLFKK